METPELLAVVDVYGYSAHVLKADYDNPRKILLKMYNPKTGKPKKKMRKGYREPQHCYLHRENIKAII